MKNNLMIKKYNVEHDNGTKSMRTVKSFFGTKLIDIEDSIIIDNHSIQYTDIDGYQYYDVDNTITNETESLLNLTNLKSSNHTIKLQTQEIFNLENNTKWIVDIDIKNILREYLFAKIKEARTFKTLKPENTKDLDINLSIYNFIDFNIINRYKLNKIDFYIKYETIITNNIFNKDIIQYNPNFIDSLYDNINLINNYTVRKRDQFENLTPIKILYNQIKKSTVYRFDYYFIVKYERI